MTNTRLEAFSDAVIAIIMTIMVLEIHPPEGSTIADWSSSIPKILAYLFSFLLLAIYWNNHHHLIKASKKVTGSVMWANMALLFWLSLTPAVTAWVGENQNYLQEWPVALYAIIGFFTGLSYYILTRTIIAANPESKVVERIGKDKKGMLSEVIYLISIPIAFISPITTLILLWSTALIWVIPDKRLADLD